MLMMYSSDYMNMPNDGGRVMQIVPTSDDTDADANDNYGYYTKEQWITYISTSRFSSTLSVIGSIAIIFMILRRRKVRLLLLHNRLLLAMCFFDICSSCALGIGTAASPTDRSTYKPQIYGARGNAATCAAQGFLFTMGMSVPLFNAFLCLNYLMVIRYSATEETLKAKEPYVYLTCVLIPLVVSISSVCLDLFHPTGGLICWFPPTNDDVNFAIDERTRHMINIMTFVVLPFFVIIFLVIALSMYGVIQAVRKQEETMDQYQVPGRRRSSLFGRNSITSTHLNDGLPREGNSYIASNRRLDSSVDASSTTTTTTMVRRGNTNQMSLGSREAAVQASLYVGAFLLTWTVGSLVTFIEDSSSSLAFLNSLFIPLQGFWNFVIFVRPKYLGLRAKNGRKSKLWLLRKAIFSSVEEEEQKKYLQRRQSNLLDRRRSSTFMHTKASPRIAEEEEVPSFSVPDADNADSDYEENVQEDASDKDAESSQKQDEDGVVQQQTLGFTPEDELGSNGGNSEFRDELDNLEDLNEDNAEDDSISSLDPSILDENRISKILDEVS